MEGLRFVLEVDWIVFGVGLNVDVLGRGLEMIFGFVIWFFGVIS